MAHFIDEQKAIEQNHFEKERKEREIKRAQVCLTTFLRSCDSSIINSSTKKGTFFYFLRLFLHQFPFRFLVFAMRLDILFTIQPMSRPVDMIAHMACAGGGAAPQARRDQAPGQEACRVRGGCVVFLCFVREFFCNAHSEK
jgi:hypothetical protein